MVELLPGQDLSFDLFEDFGHREMGTWVSHALFRIDMIHNKMVKIM